MSSIFEWYLTNEQIFGQYFGKEVGKKYFDFQSRKNCLSRLSDEIVITRRCMTNAILIYSNIFEFSRQNKP